MILYVPFQRKLYSFMLLFKQNYAPLCSFFEKKKNAPFLPFSVFFCLGPLLTVLTIQESDIEYCRDFILSCDSESSEYMQRCFCRRKIGLSAVKRYLFVFRNRFLSGEWSLFSTTFKNSTYKSFPVLKVCEFLARSTADQDQEHKIPQFRSRAQPTSYIGNPTLGL